MEFAAKLANAGDRLISFLAFILIMAMLAFGGYSLWDMYSLTHEAFLSSDLLQYKPIVSEEGEVSPTLQELIAINGDVRGWLTMDDTRIDYPVVQGRDDMEYVNKDVYGEFALSGAIFMSSQNAPDFSDCYNVVYGHHVEGGAMFADVTLYQNKEFFDSHPSGMLILPDRAYSISVFACGKFDAYDKHIYCNPTDYTPANLEGFLRYIRDNAVQYRDIGASRDSRLIALSTCADAVSNNRILIFGVLGE